MDKELAQLERAVHESAYVEHEGVQQLRRSIQQFKNLILQYHGEGENSELLQNVSQHVVDAEAHLDKLRPDDVNINDWKHNIHTFGRAKTYILYPLHLLKAAIRFSPIHKNS